MMIKASHSIQTSFLTITLLSLCAVFSQGKAAARSDTTSINQDILTEVQELYGLSERQAIERLASEMEAAELERRIKRLDIESYAGSWFDNQSWKLVVAISNSKAVALIKRLGATPILVSHSLEALQAARTAAESRLANRLTQAGTFRSSYIDYMLNQVVIGVKPGKVSKAQSVLASAGLGSELIEVIEESRIATLSAPVRGANGTRNATWNQQRPNGAPWKCSIGASVVGGFVTAGHCGVATNDLQTPSNQFLGAVKGSTYVAGPGGQFRFFYEEDGAWVDTG